MIGNRLQLKHLKSNAEAVRFSIQEAFVSLLPFLILNSIVLLISNLLDISNIDIGKLNTQSIYNLSIFNQKIFYIILSISIAFHLSRLIGADRLLSILLTSLVMFSHIYFYSEGHDKNFIADIGFSISYLTTPILCVYILHFNSNWANLITYRGLNPHVIASLNGILPFLISYVVTIVIFMITNGIGEIAVSHLRPVFEGREMPDTIQTILWLAIGHLLWFLGLHGGNVFETIIDSGFLKNELFPSLNVKQFVDLFVGFGGAGSSLALLAAILLTSRDRHSRFVAIAASPFLLFNITEVIIFGLPIIFNRKLFLPFFFVPLINFSLAYAALRLGYVSFNGQMIPWITPIFLNSYLMTGGYGAAVFQLCLLLLSTAIYVPFVRAFTSEQSTSDMRSALAGELSIDEKLRDQQSAGFQRAQTSVLKLHSETQKVVELIKANKLAIYYQPKMQSVSHDCIGFEALLRLERKDGRVEGPFFMNILEQVGFASLIDRWVCSEIHKDLLQWDAEGVAVHVGINIHPESLGDDDFIDWIIELFANRDIEFEIVERAFIGDRRLIDNVNRLRKCKIAVSIDDFGSGYSNLACLSEIAVDAVKIDKSLLDRCNTKSGHGVYSNVVELCRILGFKVVAEGVETREQLNLVESFGVQTVQGWFFAPALPRRQAQEYAAKTHGAPPPVMLA